MLAWCTVGRPQAVLFEEVKELEKEREVLRDDLPPPQGPRRQRPWAPGLALQNSRTQVSRQSDKMSQKCTDDRESDSTAETTTNSTAERDLDFDLDGPASVQTSWGAPRFPRWSPLPNSVPWIGDRELPMPHGLEGGADASPADSPRPVGWSADVQAKAGAAQTKEERLSAQVHGFVKRARKGMVVYLCDMESLLLSQCLLKIDEATTTLTLQTALAPKQELQLKDLKSVMKGEAFNRRAPRLATEGTGDYLLLAFGDAPQGTLHYLFFKDTNDRNDFYTSMKVVRVMATRGVM